MFKLVVLLACIVVVTVAESGYLGNIYGSVLGYGYGGHGYGGYGYGGKAYGSVPAAVSHQSSVVYHTQPIASYATPYLSNGLYGNSYNGLSGYGLGYSSNYGYGSVYGYGNGYGYGNNYYGSHY